ncbi:tRNA (adenosine(37)-N6)-threonylcarbamoyltransferase complex dimerization subunit type 1 TsaB [Cellulomonas soli]
MHLALDTSAAVAVAVVDDGGTLLAARSDEQQRHHAELLAPMIAGALTDAGLSRTDLTSVVVGTGPAPFTGLRVGLVTARTLALALGVPVRGVPSLDALAASASHVVAPGTRVLTVTDARRREVYTAQYVIDAPGRVRVTAAPAVGAPADVVLDGAIVVGPGAALYPEVFDPQDVVPAVVDPAELARLALARAAVGESLGTEPLYLRRPDAVPTAGRKRVLG